MKRAAALAAVLILGGCGDAGKPAGASNDPYAGLDAEILKWRTEITTSDLLCQSQAAGEKCQGFEVACKAARTITPDETAKGVTAKLVAAIVWEGWDAKVKQAQRGAKTAEFSRTASGWTRVEHKPVNLTTCADL